MATTNFFGQIAQLKLNGDLQIIISNGVEGQLIVSTMLQNINCADSASANLIPLIFKGTPQELCELYFERITKPLETVSGLLDNMDAFAKQVEEMKKQSAMEKAKADQEKKEADGKDKKYHEAMKKADVLISKGEYRDAWTQLSKLSTYPQYREQIREKQEVCERKFAPDIFSLPPMDAQPETLTNVEP